MNALDRVTGAFACNIEKEIPSAIFGGGAWAIHNSNATFQGAIKDAKKLASNFLKGRELHNSDILFVGSGFNNFLAASLGSELSFPLIGPPQVEVPALNYCVTKNTREKVEISRQDTGHLDMAGINKEEEIKNLRRAYKIAHKKAKDKKFMPALTCWGPFTLASQLAGTENLMLLLKTDKSFCRELVDFAKDAILEFYEPLLKDNTLELASIAEANASADLISLNDFKTFSLPYLKRIIEEINCRGARTLLHACGDINDRIELLLNAKPSCLSIDYKTDLGRVIKKAKARTCIAGNMRATLLLKSGGEVEKSANECLRKGGGTGYVLMPGCDAPPKAKLENLKAFVDSAKNYEG